MTRIELETQIEEFCRRLLADVGLPEVKCEAIRPMPLKYRVGVTVPDVPADIVRQACGATGSMRDAWLAAWPANFSGNCPPESLAIAADNEHVIFDLVFYSARLELGDNMKASA